MKALALLFALWPMSVLAQFENPAFVGTLTYSTAAPAAGCPVSPQESYPGTSAWGFSASPANTMAGIWWTNDTARSLCRVEWTLSTTPDPPATLTTNSFTSAVYTYAGTHDLGTLVGTPSSVVTGDDSWSSTTVAFNFPTPVPLSSGTRYAVLISASFTSTTYANVFYNSYSSTNVWAIDKWTAAGATADYNEGYCLNCNLYFQ